ncbi:acyl-CoA desaturase [Faecalibacter sp. LW9]|uniref:acyl-CoA desaturase n=1 Tax=Faecalibacter sp. LW9 TaxID=3103144 RepID=UPI002AFF6D31|nr:acyl-CoA desaturase [Faecalibacter sp. LW9]
MIGVIILFVLHWYGSLFFQTFFHHRYASHAMFTMSRTWEKIFHVLAWIFQGTSYLSPYAYGVMHRLHHTHADTEKDPHSPIYDKNLWNMMWNTRRFYNEVDRGIKDIDPKYIKGVPSWRAWDKFAEHNITRIAWIGVYILLYWLVGAPLWAYFVFIPMHSLMSPLHGAIINWFSHKYGYRNYEVKDTSTNLMPVDWLMWGECLHNNHHKFGGRPNFAVKKFEFDPMFVCIRIMEKLNIIQYKKGKLDTDYM